jgi:hypothetical protein
MSPEFVKIEMAALYPGRHLVCSELLNGGHHFTGWGKVVLLKGTALRPHIAAGRTK